MFRPVEMMGGCVLLTVRGVHQETITILLKVVT